MWRASTRTSAAAWQRGAHARSPFRAAPCSKVQAPRPIAHRTDAAREQVRRGERGQSKQSTTRQAIGPNTCEQLEVRPVVALLGVGVALLDYG
eukprot:5994835-Alexandrium_andersonii.AAC.1